MLAGLLPSAVDRTSCAETSGLRPSSVIRPGFSRETETEAEADACFLIPPTECVTSKDAVC